MKSLKLIFGLLVLSSTLQACNKSIFDYRNDFCDEYEFEVRATYWEGSTTTFDTLFYDGEIRLFEVGDRENDLYSDDDSAEPKEEKVTIQFLADTKITSIIDEEGKLELKSGSHYYHSGGFEDENTIIFGITGLGGMGGGAEYEIIGTRK